MKTNNMKIIFILLLAIMVVPAHADVFPAEPFNGLQIVYSVSGATLETPIDVGGFTTSRTIKGTITGGTLTVSGTAKGSWGYGATLDVTLHVEGQEDKTFHQEKFPAEGLAKDPMNQEFSVSLPVPSGAKTASFSIDMVGDYNAGTRGLVVSGKLDRLPVAIKVATNVPCSEALFFYSKDVLKDYYTDENSLYFTRQQFADELTNALDKYINEGGKAYDGVKYFDAPNIAMTLATGAMPQGTEEKLRDATKALFEEKSRLNPDNARLSPGELFYLALKVTRGNVRDALLTSHATHGR